MVEEEEVEIPDELEEVSLCRLAHRRVEMPVLLLVTVVGRRNHPEYVCTWDQNMYQEKKNSLW